VGLHEFADWLDRVGSELMLAVNLGTRGTLDALRLLEYANIGSGTALADQRASNGRPEPLGVKMWCLGNEMDGPWQLGHRSAEDYGKLASRVAKAMRQVDPDLELVACGSSNAAMPTFGEWERVVLTHTYDDVDFISCHVYYEERNGDLGSFLASATNMDHFIDSVIATADHVKAVRNSSKTINISFDEWNVWYNDRYQAARIEGTDNWPVAPRLLEDVYNVADAVVVGNLLISLLRHADRVTSASLAQLVNVIAPIMTEPGGPAWRQTIFFPFALTSRLARGTALDVRVAGDSYESEVYGTVPTVDAVATFDEETGQTAVFLVNRSTSEEAELTINVSRLGDVSILDAQTLADSDVYAANTLENPDRVGLAKNDSAVIDDGTLTITLPAVSWTALSIG
jgi:alpha-N-arabinofuranosidase